MYRGASERHIRTYSVLLFSNTFSLRYWSYLVEHVVLLNLSILRALVTAEKRVALASRSRARRWTGGRTAGVSVVHKQASRMEECCYDRVK